MESEQFLTIGNVIKHLRTKHSLSCRALSALAGLSPSYVSKVETGQLSPSFDAFCSMVKALKVSDNEIVFLVKLNQRILNEAER